MPMRSGDLQGLLVGEGWAKNFSRDRLLVCGEQLPLSVGESPDMSTFIVPNPSSCKSRLLIGLGLWGSLLFLFAF